jgi:hypothetical protein
MINKLWGLDQATYDKLAATHSKANIFGWLIAGAIYNIWQSNVLSLSTLLLFFPGIFVMSFASMLTFWVEIKKHQIVPGTKNISVLILFTIWGLIDLAYPIFLSIGYILLIEYIYKLF